MQRWDARKKLEPVSRRLKDIISNSGTVVELSIDKELRKGLLNVAFERA